jgi:CDP-diacylglycerol--glycerol-3-phosphate 3-phosphatidyltransferase
MAQNSPGGHFRLIPPALVSLRLALGPAILFGIIATWPGAVIVVMLATGLLSDIFDGLIARRIGTATPRLRQADSVADIIFWLFAAAASAIASPGFIRNHAWWLGALALGEGVCQTLSFARFHRPVATHCYVAKTWGLLLFASFAWLLDGRRPGFFINFVLAYGLAVYAEIFSILIIANDHPVDAKSLLHVWRNRAAGAACKRRETPQD